MRLLTIPLFCLLATVAFGFQSQTTKPGSPAGTPGVRPKPGPPAGIQMQRSDASQGASRSLRPVVSAPETYESVANDADRRYQDWHTAQSDFESEFALRMGEARAASSDTEERKRRFCSDGYTQKLAQLRILLEAWLSSQVRYWSRYRQDVRRALDAANAVLVHRSDAAGRLNREAEEARKDLDSLKRQREETRKSLAAVSGTDEKSGAAKAAVAKLDSLIALAEGRIKAATNGKGMLEDTPESLSGAKQQEALLGRIDAALKLVDFDRRYWSSIYSLRSVQISEICTPPSAPPSVVK